MPESPGPTKVRLTLSVPESFTVLLEYVAFRLGQDRSSLVVDLMVDALAQMYDVLKDTPALDRLTPEERRDFIERCLRMTAVSGFQMGLDIAPPGGGGGKG